MDAEKDFGGSGQFDLRMTEAIDRAKLFALDRQISLVVGAMRSFRPGLFSINSGLPRERFGDCLNGVRSEHLVVHMDPVHRA
jgi:hypothetical protein